MGTNFWGLEMEPQGSNSNVKSIQLLAGAIERELLSQKEIAAVRMGTALLEKKHLFNLNADLHYPTGAYIPLYEGRGVEIDSRILLGLEVVEAYCTGN